jgi:hypothetical protein
MKPLGWQFGQEAPSIADSRPASAAGAEVPIIENLSNRKGDKS